MATSTPGTLHYIPPNLCAFEPTKPLVRSLNINTLLWIGGMFDTLHSVQYPFKIAQSLGPTWSVMTASLGSAGHSWGVSSIAKDAEEMAQIVAYLRELRPGGKVVIMGHSTGCQDCMEYVVGKNASARPAVDGIILQAPVSDREALAEELPQAFKHEADQLALKMCREKHSADCMPSRLTKSVYGRLAVTAKRWLDVSNPGGADDYFSSDLTLDTLKTTFGKLPASSPLLLLCGGADDSVPARVDLEKLIRSWMDVVKAGGGVVDESNGAKPVPGASHNLNGDPDEVVADLIQRVVGFIAQLDKGSFGGNAGARI